jgi:hypothetical protein
MPSTKPTNSALKATEEQIAVVDTLAVKFNFDKKSAVEYLESTLNGSESDKKKKSSKASDTKQKEKEDKATKKAEKEAAKAAKAAEPKRPLSAYLLFNKEMRPQVVDFLTKKLEKDAKLSQPEVMTELGKRWGELSEAGKNEWKVKALALANVNDSVECE